MMARILRWAFRNLVPPIVANAIRRTRIPVRVRPKPVMQTLSAPRGHKLAEYQHRYPMYDTYFLPYLRNQANDAPHNFIDVGANIGDTARAILESSPNSKVVAVEGSVTFLPYLRENTRGLTQVDVIPRYVEVAETRQLSVVEESGTGRLVEAQGSVKQLEFVSVPELLAKATAFFNDDRRVIWKSDTDGHDIEILRRWWNQIIAICDGVWIEWDPHLHAGDPDSFEQVIELIGSTGLSCCVFDNFGRPLVLLTNSGRVRGLTDLTNYLRSQIKLRHTCIYYFDIWLLPEREAALLWETALAIPNSA